MNFIKPFLLLITATSLSACFNGPPGNDTVQQLLEKNGKEVAAAQASLFRSKPLSEEELEKLPNAYSNIQVTDCREDKMTESEYLCFVNMNVKTVLGNMPFEEDVRIRLSEEGEWRLVSK
jgi:hypothetical protein